MNHEKLAFFILFRSMFIDPSSQSQALFEGSLESKLPTLWTNEKGEVGRVREDKKRRRKVREERESEERSCRCAKR